MPDRNFGDHAPCVEIHQGDGISRRVGGQGKRPVGREGKFGRRTIGDSGRRGLDSGRSQRQQEQKKRDKAEEQGSHRDQVSKVSRFLGF
jgi:hypothetical protein